MRVTKAFRVGKGSPEKPRLLIVGLENVETKADLLKLAPDLRHTQQWKRVFVTPDLTWQEREQGRKLRMDLKQRMENGETNLVIRRGKIVKLTPAGNGQEIFPTERVVNGGAAGGIDAGNPAHVEDSHLSNQVGLVRAEAAEGSDGATEGAGAPGAAEGTGAASAAEGTEAAGAEGGEEADPGVGVQPSVLSKGNQRPGDPRPTQA